MCTNCKCQNKGNLSHLEQLLGELEYDMSFNEFESLKSEILDELYKQRE